MNDFENEDIKDDFEVEITDLDLDREKSKTPVLWLKGQRLRSQAKSWITLLTVVGMTILILTFSSPLLPPFSHSTQKTPGVGASHSLPQPTACSSPETIIILRSNENATMTWYKARQSSSAVPTGSGSCVHSTTIQLVPGSNGTGLWKIKK